MIIDNSIDEFEARYWCVFSDKLYRDLAKSINNPNKEQKKLNSDIDAAIDSASKKQKLLEKYESEGKGLKTKIDNIVGKPSPELQKELQQLYKKDRAAFQSHPYVVKRREAYQQIALANNDEKGVICDMDDNGNVVPMTMADTKNNTTLSGFLSNIGKNFTENLGSILSNVLAGAAIAGVSYLLFKSMPYIAKKTKYMYKKFKEGNKLAECLFSTSDGNEYRFFYDFKIQKWILAYQSMKVSTIETFPSKDDVNSFLQTEFCKNFVDQCRSYILPIIDNVDGIGSILINGNVIKDSKAKQLVKDIIEAAPAIKANMFKLKVRYQD